MMRKGEPLGMLNWKTDKIHLMTSTDKKTFDEFRKKIEGEPHIPEFLIK